MAQNKSYGRGIRDLIDFSNVFSAAEQNGGKNVMGRFLEAAQKGFAKFA
jgi:hypothetical protein